MLKPILLVEDDPRDLELTLVALERSQLANEVIVMRNGEVVEQGPAAEIFDRPKSDYTKALLAAALHLRTAPVDVVRQ